jgi:hypothetical protein
MSAFFRHVLMVTGSTLLHVSAAAAQDAKADALAREINGKFVLAIEARDADAMMKLVRVPWFGLGQEIVIRDEKQLRATFKKVLDGFKGFRPKSKDADEVLSYAKFNEKYKLKNDLLKQLAELKMMADDRVVIGPILGVVLVQVRDGKATIVGALGD